MPVTPAGLSLGRGTYERVKGLITKFSPQRFWRTVVTDGIFKGQSSYPLVQVDRPYSEYQQNILCYPKQTTNTKRHQKKDFGS